MKKVIKRCLALQYLSARKEGAAHVEKGETLSKHKMKAYKSNKWKTNPVKITTTKQRINSIYKKRYYKQTKKTKTNQTNKHNSTKLTSETHHSGTPLQPKDNSQAILL